MRNGFRVLVVTVVSFFLAFVPVRAESPVITAHLFYGQECPHCEAELEWFETYLEQNSDVRLVKYEVWHDSVNQQRLLAAGRAIGKNPSSVPCLIIGKEMIVGYIDDKGTGRQIADLIDFYRQNPYADLVSVALSLPTPDVTTAIVTEVGEGNLPDEVASIAATIADYNPTFSVPFLNTVDPQTVSLPLVSIIIGAVDGFNPCAMWVLII